MKVYLEAERYGGYTLTAIEPDGSDGPDRYFQTDWDNPGLASSLGIWRPCHNCTDGTVDCSECGQTASAMIEAATAALDEHDGCIIEAIGVEEYFA